MTFVMGEFLTLAPGSDRIPVELFQILKDDAVESAALNMQYAICTQYAICQLPAVKYNTHQVLSLVLVAFGGPCLRTDYARLQEGQNHDILEV